MKTTFNKLGNKSNTLVNLATKAITSFKNTLQPKPCRKCGNK